MRCLLRVDDEFHGHYIDIDGDVNWTGTAVLFCGHLTSSDRKCNVYSTSASTALFGQFYFECTAVFNDEEEEEKKENMQL
jgi:hypothetical protein